MSAGVHIFALVVVFLMASLRILSYAYPMNGDEYQCSQCTMQDSLWDGKLVDGIPDQGSEDCFKGRS